MTRKLENTIGVRIPASVREQIERLAAAEDRPPSYIARKWILAALDKERSQAAQRESAGTSNGNG